MTINGLIFNFDSLDLFIIKSILILIIQVTYNCIYF